MDFLSFIKHSRVRMTDPGVISCMDTLLALEDLPASSDPRLLAPAIYTLLDPKATKGFQMSMMVYQQFEPANELPQELHDDRSAFLAAINTIIDLQNSDPAYRWPSPMHEQRFGKRK